MLKSANISLMRNLGVQLETFLWMGISAWIVVVAIKSDDINQSLNLFQRSGAIVAMIGGFASYRDYRGKLIQNIMDLSKAASDQSAFIDIFNNQEIILRRSRIAEIALIAIGTLISTFGDLLI